ncbi:caspase family protein [Methyloceanibacter sp.]|uniref:caspase family protein n=1 Tax=Methyloceanibacter sp. TaxID=1965321 RepID=UPI003D6C955A
MRILARLVGLTACLFFVLSPALAAKRVALVIGNNDYENVPALQKAVNDAGAISQELAKLGFDVVSAENVGRRAMSRALVELEGKIETGDTALIYFAGHGFAVDGTNYLLPVDVPAAGPGEEGLVRDASFAANGLSDRLQEKGATTVILILDACRDNPFALPGKRSIGLTRGLSRMDPAEGMFVLFSAGQGQSALDRLSDTDENPNSVFTRTLLKELEEPGLSMVQIAKRTQSEVKELAAKVDHVQVPAYYDQIVGDLYLAPEGAALAKGSIGTLEEGGGKSVLPAPEQKVAALPANPQPIASFTRSNSGWMVNVSLPEAATQFGYRIGDKGAFTDAGLLDALDQRTGARMPKTSFEMAPDQGKTTIYVTWRDRRGEQADIVPINFDPTSALADEHKKILEQFWTSWIAFREWQGMTVYFTQLVSYRCAIKQVRYSFGDQPVDKIFKLPPCDPTDPNAVPDGATLYMKVPPKTQSMQVQLIYADGTMSPARSFNAPK